MLQSQCLWVLFLFGALARSQGAVGNGGDIPHQTIANRLTYLDEDDPFYPGADFPKLTTPQWVGEPGVEAVVVLAIDDMRQAEKYELVLRPILQRLKQIDGRAPVSIMCTSLDPGLAQLQQWQAEGVSLEVHTLDHPCPLLANSNFVAAAQTYHECVDRLNRIPGNHPVAFRMPCCDSIDSPSPRFYAEIFNRTNATGQFLTLDSSVMHLYTATDPSLPKDLVLDATGRDRFRKYVPFPSFVTMIENYPYPYVIGRLCWELPAMVPSDWEAQHLQGTNNPATVADWKAALDATVRKQGVFSFIFHPHGWIRPDQLVEFIDYAVQRYGHRVKFLNFHEVEERLRKNLLAGQSLRRADGRDNGVRLLDVNNDGFLDVVIGNAATKVTRIWSPADQQWRIAEFPVPLILEAPGAAPVSAGVQFGVLEPDAHATLLVNGPIQGAWHFDGQHWQEQKVLLNGLELKAAAVLTSAHGRDRGVRLRDLDGDGRCELIVGNESQSAVFAWSPTEESWKQLAYSLPPGTAIVDALGRDNGLRFVDVNQDGYEDVLWSNPSGYLLSLFVPQAFLGFQQGWSREVVSGKRGDGGDFPLIVRSGSEPNNGVWFHSRHMWVQNEETAALPDHVERRSFDQLLSGLQPLAKSPAESLACLRVRPGFKAELVASEPLLKDPIAFEWGADGKLWVVEMGDYPLGLDGYGKSGGIIRFLEDTDGDGRYDRSTVFLEGVNFPTGVMPWGKGVLVSAAPEIFYAEDSDGDGKADIRIPLFHGFGEGNQQHRLNGFDYGLDNWVYGANGDSGGRIQAVGRAPSRADVRAEELSSSEFELRGHDFRFRPDRGLFQTVSGQTQYGRHRDDWGNWFGNNNSIWLWHVLLPEEYLARNPYLAVKSVKQILADYPEATRVFASSRSMQRFNDIGMLNHVTSANSPMPYRDDLFGPDFASSVFVSEPVHNLVHRENLVPDGVTFNSHRAPDEQTTEFLCSTDNWFRPTMLKTGPDGALYVADMYRLVIEHPEWIPADSQQHVDLRAGHELGRIYRVYPTNATLRTIPHLDQLDPVALAERLGSPNGWTRDTVQRLLVSSGADSAVPTLVRLARQSEEPKVRIQALGTLQGLGRLTPELLVASLGDSNPAVREHSIRLSEPFLRDRSGSLSPLSGPPGMANLERRLLESAVDPSMRVRFQLAFTLGEWLNPDAGRALVRLALHDPQNAPMQIAILSSALPHFSTMLDAIFSPEPSDSQIPLIQELIKLSVRLGKEESLGRSLQAIAQGQGGGFKAWQLAATDALARSGERRVGSFSGLRDHASASLGETLTRVDNIFVYARKLAPDSGAREEERVLAVRLLGHGLTEQEEDVGRLSALLRPQIPSPVQEAALGNLREFQDPAIGAMLLKGWKSYEPALRDSVLGVLLNRAEWADQLLAAMEKESVAPGQISLSHRQRLLGFSQEPIRARARKIFSISADRQRLIETYRQSGLTEGDAARGAALFAQNCATCHRLHDVGTNVGPDLGALANKSLVTLLTAILDPNQAVEARFLNYTATTKSDREISGIIVAESPSSITLRSAGGNEETILRSDLHELISSGLSLMPEGFEKLMTPRDLGDLIAFLTRSPSAAK